MFFNSFYRKNPIKQAILNLRRHRGMNDLLSYLVLWDEQTILHKDGAWSRHFRYQLPDLTTATDAVVDFHASTWGNGFHFLGDGWMVESNVVSQPYAYQESPHEFPEIVSALIDDERRLQYQSGRYFVSTYYLSMTWKPKHVSLSKLRRFAMEYNDVINDKDFIEERNYFDRTVREYLDYLKRSFIHVEVLSEDDLVTFLHQCLMGQSNRLVAPRIGAYLDVYLSQEFVAGFEPKMGSHFVKLLAIDDVPERIHPMILKSLNHFPVSYRWSSRFVPLDPLTAKAYLKRFERSWSSKAIGLLGILRESLGLPAKRDEDAQQMADQLKGAQFDLSGRQLGYGFYNSVLVLMHDEIKPLREIANAMIAQIQQWDFQIREEGVNATEAYLGSLPSHGGYNLRKMPIDTDFVSCVLPISDSYSGESKAPCPLSGYQNQSALLLTSSQGNRPFYFNCHVGDVGHTAILGPTGSGKSTLNATLIVSHRKYADSRIIVLDKDYSNRFIIKALQGNYYDLSKNDCQLAPLSRVHYQDETSIDQALEWLTSCFVVQKVALTPERQQLLRDALERLGSDKPHYKCLNHLSLQDVVLREALQVFNSGRRQLLLNGREPAFSNADVIGLEMGEIISSTDGISDLNVPVIKAIFHELAILFREKRPTLLILEEAWLYLKHPLFLSTLTDWFKTLRKANVSVIFVSQDLDDIVESKAASVIQNACMTRIYLPNAAAGEARVKALYQAFGLNEAQINIIQQAQPKQDYYYHSVKGNRLFQLDLGPLAQSFLCVSQKNDWDRFKKIFQKSSNNPKWVLEWLQYKGLTEWVDFVKQHYAGVME